MRSPIGPALIVIGLASAAVLVLVLLQSMRLRDELREARDDVTRLEQQVETFDTITPEELRTELAKLESGIRNGLITTGAAGGSTASADILDRIDDVLARITALDRRVDEICDGVPVC